MVLIHVANFSSYLCCSQGCAWLRDGWSDRSDAWMGVFISFQLVHTFTWTRQVFVGQKGQTGSVPVYFWPLSRIPTLTFYILQGYNSGDMVVVSYYTLRISRA